MAAVTWVLTLPLTTAARRHSGPLCLQLDRHLVELWRGKQRVAGLHRSRGTHLLNVSGGNQGP
jgi:hypothetical protein